MGVYIKGMEMPKSCFECFAFNAENTYCALYSYGIPARHSLKPYEKPEWCELIEVPTSHGRLIDADVYCEFCKDDCHWRMGDDPSCEFCKFKDAPTIIESEGE